MGPVRQHPIQRTVSLFICVCITLCTIVAHNIAQNRPDTFPTYPLDNHHCSDDVYLREGGAITTTIKHIYIKESEISDHHAQNHNKEDRATPTSRRPSYHHQPCHSHHLTHTGNGHLINICVINEYTVTKNLLESTHQPNHSQFNGLR